MFNKTIAFYSNNWIKLDMILKQNQAERRI